MKNKIIDSLEEILELSVRSSDITYSILDDATDNLIIASRHLRRGNKDLAKTRINLALEKLKEINL